MSVKAEHYDVIRKPIITEKATMASESGAVVFEVAVESNKPQIKEAIEALFGAAVIGRATHSGDWCSVRRHGPSPARPSAGAAGDGNGGDPRKPGCAGGPTR